MIKINYYRFFIYIISIFFSIQLSQAQCEWLYANLETEAYEIAEDGTITLLYCNNISDSIWADDGYIDATWEYETSSGEECEDWEWIGDNFYFSVDSNEPCLEGLSQVTVTFTGYVEGENIEPDVCEFNIEFYNTPDPSIIAENYNTDAQIVICEENLITLTASGLGAEYDEENTVIQWYLNNEAIDGENYISLDITNTNYTVNASNVFYFTVSNYCTNLNSETAEESDWLTITIYEGYSDNCNSCRWDPFTQWTDSDGISTTGNTDFLAFSPNSDGDNDYFPEPANNEENRSFEGTQKWPTCEATIYQLTIFNRLGREIWSSEKDNEPWDGNLENGRECKEGTYFYKMEYVLHPLLDGENEETNLPHTATIISTGTVYLDR